VSKLWKAKAKFSECSKIWALLVCIPRIKERQNRNQQIDRGRPTEGCRNKGIIKAAKTSSSVEVNLPAEDTRACRHVTLSVFLGSLVGVLIKEMSIVAVNRKYISEKRFTKFNEMFFLQNCKKRSLA
jgi:hypothetical protein